VTRTAPSDRPEPELPPHPDCPVCSVTMWLTEIVHVTGPPKAVQYYYECKACNARVVLPKLA